MERLIYLDKVITFLKQELPEPYRGLLTVRRDHIMVTLPEHELFQSHYEMIHPLIVRSIGRIRDRQIDLHFTIRNAYQERDFTVLKLAAHHA